MIIRVLLLGLTATLLSNTLTNASEIKQWNGAYGGLQTGWTAIDEDLSQTENQGNNSFRINSEGPSIGALVGYNWVTRKYLIGIEGDISTNQPLNKNDTKAGYHTETEWIATLRGRAGLLLGNNFLLYATAGLAATETELNHQNSHEWQTTYMGWTAGAGFEFSSHDGIRFGFDALYVGFEEESKKHNQPKKGNNSLTTKPSGLIGRARIIIPIK